MAPNEDTVILQRLEELKKLGISIAIDDFGTGFSSFNRLRTFPIDLLKIDICFVHGISSGSQKDRSIIKSIIQLAKNLGIETLAEGVETEDQFVHLKEIGCNYMQGYYFYKPMPPNEIR
ncbi:MAG TPA: EAL domain-containing protein [Firmicutes bacterium]|nr:EAL domain-containing protein [Bacillota bacterium]